jgi:hypothetical protein
VRAGADAGTPRVALYDENVEPIDDVDRVDLRPIR